MDRRFNVFQSGLGLGLLLWLLVIVIVAILTGN